MKFPSNTVPKPKVAVFISIFIFVGTLLTLTFSPLRAQDDEITLERTTKRSATLLGSTKEVNQETATAGSTLDYTITISNDLDIAVTGIVITDVLPAELTYVTDTLDFPVGTVGNVTGNTITWSGSLADSQSLDITFQAMINEGVTVGTHITNTVTIDSGTKVVTRTATTEIISSTSLLGKIFIPVSTRPYPRLPLAGTFPNAGNQWQLSWDVGINELTYELQEAKESTFASPTIYPDIVNQTTVQVTHSPSPNNTYYYRVRVVDGDQVGPWSNTLKIVGNYRDDFDNDNTNWAVRRMSLLENTTVAYYEGKLKVDMNDKWDWFIASPLREAPAIPYALEMRSKLATIGPPHPNLVSHGPVVGGDWNGEACPHIGNVYLTNHCFNHFYNFNTIHYGPLKTLYERVDYLWWCEECGGPWLKRALGNWSEHQIVGDEPNPNWHTYRVEVRESGISYYVDGRHIFTNTDDNFVNDPYFGVFVSTDEYRPSTWFVDWLTVSRINE